MLSVRHSHPALAALEAVQMPQMAEYNRVAAEKFMKSLDRRLAEQAFIAADRFTIADIVAVIGLDFARMIKYRPPEELTHLARWLAECRARPAAGAGA
jgi:glutathione S-transferase